MAEARLRKGSAADPEQTIVLDSEDDVDLDAGTLAPGAEQNEDGSAEDGGAVLDAETGEPLTEADREAKRQLNRENRQRKRDAAKRREDAYQNRIRLLEQKLAESDRRIERVEGHTTGQDIQRIDTALGQTRNAVAHWKAQIAAAAASGDGNALAEAQEKWYEARANVDTLANLKQAAVAHRDRPAAPAPLDPLVQSHYQSWVKDHSWYNGQGRDQDSKVMLAIDNAVVEEGFDPATSEYWAELTRRGKQLLPHRFGAGRPAPADDDDDDDDAPPARPAARRRDAPQPSAGSSRDSVPASRSEFRLSPDRVRAMKEAGIWDDPKERADMVKRYREQDRANGVNR